MPSDTFPSSKPLAAIFAIIGPFVLVSYYLALKDATEKEIDNLFAGITGFFKVPFAVLPPMCAIAYIYSTWFVLNLPADATVLGMAWKGGGETLVCVLYFIVIFLSCFWMPATVRCLRAEKGGVAAVIFILNGVGIAACVLAVCALTTKGTGLPNGGLKLHQGCALLFAAQTQITDGFIWSYMFAKMMDERRGGSDYAAAGN